MTESFVGLDALAAPLAEIERRSLDAGEQDGDACVTNDGARPHVETITAHAGEVALFVFEFEAAIAEGDDFDFEFDGTCIESATFATEAKGDFSADSGGFGGFHSGGIGNAEGAVGDLVVDEGAQETCAIAGSTAADVVGMVRRGR